MIVLAILAAGGNSGFDCEMQFQWHHGGNHDPILRDVARLGRSDKM